MTSLASNLFKSPIFGSSIDVNFLGTQKFCSFDCPYCNLGNSSVRMTQIKKEVQFPSPEDIDRSLRESLKNAFQNLNQ